MFQHQAAQSLFLVNAAWEQSLLKKDSNKQTTVSTNTTLDTINRGNVQSSVLKVIHFLLKQPVGIVNDSISTPQAEGNVNTKPKCGRFLQTLRDPHLMKA